MTWNGVALLGEPGSGKTTIANALVSLEGGERLTFAMALKKELAWAMSMDADGSHDSVAFVRHLDAMNDPATKDFYRTPLQWWGTEFRRASDEDYWVNQLRDEMRPGSFYVVDDCRYWNEFRMLQAAGFAFIRLVSGATTRPLTGEQLAHPSEKDWPLFPVALSLPFRAGPNVQAARISEWLHSDKPWAVPA